MPAFTGTGNIRQNRQVSNLHTYGLNIFQILQNKNLNTKFFYLILGSGPQNNRIIAFNRRRGIYNNF